MTNLSKRSTVYFDPAIHQALREKATTSQLSVSELVDEAVRLLIQEDQEDLAAAEDRVDEPELSREDLFRALKMLGKI